MELIERFRPTATEDNDDFDALYSVQKNEIEEIHSTSKKIIDNLYVSTCDIDGIKRWEKFFNIKQNKDYTLEERRMIVLNKILYRPPFTRQRLTEILETIWGKGKYIYELYPDEYKLIVDIDTNNPIIYLQFSKQLRNIVPANLYLVLSIQYTNIYLGRNYTYGAMEELTYEELSQYASIDED
jgi:hypothetical protein